MKIILSGLLLLNACAGNTYKIHIGQSYFEKAKSDSHQGHSQIEALEVNSDYKATGIYSEEHPFLEKYPFLRTYHPKTGLSYIPIADKIDCHEGALVKIEGRTKKDSIQYPYTKKTHHYQLLEPASVQVLAENRQVRNRITVEYQKIREYIEQQLRIKDSKLRLSPKPSWIIWYDSAKKNYIFTSFQYDLMYASNVEFIVDSKSHQIKSVYARQWFKGEL